MRARAAATRQPPFMHQRSAVHLLFPATHLWGQCCKLQQHSAACLLRLDPTAQRAAAHARAPVLKRRTKQAPASARMQELPPDAQGSLKEGASSYTLKQPGKDAKIQVLPRPYFAAEALLMQSKEGSCPRQSAGHTAMAAARGVQVHAYQG